MANSEDSMLNLFDKIMEGAKRGECPVLLDSRTRGIYSLALRQCPYLNHILNNKANVFFRGNSND